MRSQTLSTLICQFVCFTSILLPESTIFVVVQFLIVRFWSVKLPYGVHPSTLYVCAFVVAIQATSNAISVIKDLVVRSFMLNFCWELKLLCDCFCLLCIIFVFIIYILHLLFNTELMFFTWHFVYLWCGCLIFNVVCCRTLFVAICFQFGHAIGINRSMLNWRLHLCRVSSFIHIRLHQQQW